MWVHRQITPISYFRQINYVRVWGLKFELYKVYNVDGMSQVLKTLKPKDLNILLLIANTLFTCDNYEEYMIYLEKKQKILITIHFSIAKITKNVVTV